MKRRNALAVAILAVSLAGCAAQIKRDAVLERSADRSPEWAMKQTFERDGNLFVVGEGTDIEGYGLALRMAKATAAQSLAEAIGLRVKSELTRSAQRLGMASSGNFVQDTVAMASELVTVQDLTHEETYREKIARVEDDAIRYHVVALYRLPISQYKAAKIRALESMQGRAVKQQDRQAAADAKRLLEEVKAE